MKILDKDGLAYFWSKLKAWVNGLFVHLSGDETINGVKTFTGSLVRSDNVSVNLAIFRNPYYTRGTVPSNSVYSSISFVDASGSEWDEIVVGNHGRLGVLECDAAADGSTFIRIAAWKNETGTNTSSDLRAGIDANGIIYSESPSTSLSRNSSRDILTRDWIPKDTRIVHTTGAETVDGVKTFMRGFVQKYGSYERGVTTAYTQNNLCYFYDKNDVTYGLITCVVNADKSGGVRMYAYDTTATSGGSIGYLGIGCNSSGSVETHAPTPATADNSTQIATTEFVKAQGYLTSHQSLANYVTLNTNQNITGVKTIYDRGEKLRIKNPYIARGDTPSITNYSTIAFHDNSATDSLATRFGIVENIVEQASGKVVMRIGAYKNVSGSTDLATLDLWHWPDGTAYVNLPTPPASSNTNTAATTEWVRTYGSNFVALTGNQTVTGTKTFNTLNITSSGNLSGTANTKAFYVCGGTDNTGAGGAYMILVGSTNTGGNAGCFFLRAATSTSNVKTMLGRPNGTLTWDGQAIQTSSDARLKTPMSDVPDDALDAWEDVRWGRFKMLDAVEEKGADKARFHVGLIAQQAKAAFDARGLDGCAYGILCYDDADFDDLWMVRYTEALCMEAAYQRRENARLKKRVADLEERLAALELRLGSE